MDKLSGLTLAVRYIDKISGIILGIITVVIFTSAILRYLFSYPLPDSFDISRLLLGACIMWGLCSVSYNREHISVDLLWNILPQKYRIFLDLLSQTITASFLTCMVWMLLVKIEKVYRSNEQTFDLRLEVWPFYVLAWIGLSFAALLSTLGLWWIMTKRVKSHSNLTTELNGIDYE